MFDFQSLEFGSLALMSGYTLQGSFISSTGHFHGLVRSLSGQFEWHVMLGYII